MTTVWLLWLVLLDVEDKPMVLTMNTENGTKRECEKLERAMKLDYYVVSSRCIATDISDMSDTTNNGNKLKINNKE